MNNGYALFEFSYKPAEYFFTLLLGMGLCLYITPIIKEAAIKYDIVDRPDGRLKKHAQPVAYLGGLTIYLSFLCTLALTFDFSREVLGLLLSGTIIAMLGIVDDLRPLSPRSKLIGQAIAVFVLMKSGIYMQIVFLPVWLCLLLTFVWLMTTTNAFNIIDVMDGLSSGIACLITFVLFVVAVLNERAVIAVLTIALAGVLLGFLRHNFNPASMYLGDMGSMFLGLMLGALAMVGSYTDNNILGCFAPLIIMGIPLFDTLFVMYIRWCRGVPVIYGSPDHFALRLRKWKLTTRQTVIVSYAVCLILGLCAIALMQCSSMVVALAILVCIVLCGLLAGFFLKKVDMTM